MTASNVERKYEVNMIGGVVAPDGRQFGYCGEATVAVLAELNTLSQRVAELEKDADLNAKLLAIATVEIDKAVETARKLSVAEAERAVLVAGLKAYRSSHCDCEPGVETCAECTKANEAIDATNSLKIEGL